MIIRRSDKGMLHLESFWDWVGCKMASSIEAVERERERQSSRQFGLLPLAETFMERFGSGLVPKSRLKGKYQIQTGK